MRNKYFEELQEEGVWDDEDDEVIPADPKEDEKAVRVTFIRVVLTIISFSLLEALVILFLIGGFLPEFTRLKWTSLVGILVGTIVSIFLFWFMKKQIEEIVDMEEQKAKGTLKFGAIARILIVIAILAVSFITKIANPIAVIVSILNLKFAAIIQPFLDKLFKIQ